MKKGRFVVFDGLDGVGKGVFLNECIEEVKKEGRKIFDVHEYWKKNNYPPSSDNLASHNVIITSEPTFAGIGRYIREELIAKNGRDYSPQTIAEAYALDRRILYEMVILPALEQGIDIFQSRSISTTIIYQRQSALDLGEDFSVKEILDIPGNAFCMKHPMDFLIIPTIKNVEEALKRVSEREKDDNCIFENLEFQLKIKEQYESYEFRKIFEDQGVKIVYLDAGKSLDFSKEQAREFYRINLKK